MRIVRRNGDVKLALVVLEVPVHFAAVYDGHVTDLTLLRILQKLRKGDLLLLAAAGALFKYLPEQHQARKYKHPEDDRLDRRIHE